MPQNKHDTPLTFKRQVKRLREHNIKFSDAKNVKKYFSNVSYYRIKGYWYQFKKETSELVENGTTFLKIQKIIEFDAQLSSLIFQLIRHVEVKFKTLLAYWFSNNHGPYSYLNSLFFTDYSEHLAIIQSFFKERKRNKDLPFVRHYEKFHGGQFPLWVAIELFSFNDMIRFFNIFKNDDKKYVELEYNMDSWRIIDWLRDIKKVRNICAHHGRIYSLSFGDMSSLYSEYSQYTTDKIFHIILMLKRLCFKQVNEWKNFVISLKKIMTKYGKFIDKSLIGFPDKWFDILSKELERKKNK